MGQNYRFQLLAPSHSRTNPSIGRTRIDEHNYDRYLSSLQQLRGRVYEKDGAIRPWEMDEDGRFEMRGDDRSWHFVLLDDSDTAIGCARYLVHPNTVAYERLRVSQSFLARSNEWGARVRDAVEADLRTARMENFSYVEIGGWALAEEWRNTKAALEILVASYALASLWGGCIGSCTATVRHGSSSILRRIGGCSMQFDGSALPPYEDPQYGCFMELLKFDSRFPEERFLPLINQLRARIGNSTAIRATGVQDWKKVPEFSTRPFPAFRFSPASF